MLFVPVRRDRIRHMTQSENTIKLDQFLKWVGVAPTGGQAKLMITGSEVLVNGAVEIRRERQLVTGDSRKLKQTLP